MTSRNATSLAPAVAPLAWGGPETSPLFERWVDPTSGIESWILTRRVAPLQQSFYFVNQSLTHDGRFLWFYASFPPGGDAYYGRQLGVADLLRGEVRHYPETQFADASPGVDLDSGEVFWTTGLEVWRRGPRAADTAECVNSFPNELAKHRRPLRLATHLTFSSDRRSLNVDAQIGDEWFVGELPLDGSDYRHWQTLDRCYNHAQFSPTEPDVMLLAQDGWHDASTGLKGEGEDRLWILRRGEPARPICPDEPAWPGRRGHEWWDADGEHVWYIDYQNGTERVNLRTGERELVWPAGHSHSHATRDARLLVGDVKEHGDWSVKFLNRDTGREVDIVAELPEPPFPRSRYHVHPHPQFCGGDRYVCYTTNVLGRVDVALVSVDHLRDRTS